MSSGVLLAAKTYGSFVKVASATASITGHVKDAVTGDRLEGVLASLTIAGATYSITTDSEGRFVFKELYAGTYSLTFSKEGYISQLYTIPLVEGEDALLVVELVPVGYVEDEKSKIEEIIELMGQLVPIMVLSMIVSMMGTITRQS